MTAVALHDPSTQPQRNLSVIAAMAGDYGMRADAFEATLRATIVPKACTREEFAAFILVAKQYHLNPITREIYAIPKKGGGIQPVVGVDGWYSIMNSHPQFDGIEFDDHFDGDRLVAITCRVYRKDRSRHIAVRELLAECKQGTEPWSKWPYRMLRHKAAIQAARAAFGFSGIVDPDEADRFKAEPDQQRPAQRRPPSRQLQTVELVANEPIIDDEIPDFSAAGQASPASEAPAADAGEPASSPPTGDAGNPSSEAEQMSPVEEARQAGREACEAGIDFKDIPAKYTKYTSYRKAWEQGYQDFAAEAGA